MSTLPLIRVVRVLDPAPPSDMWELALRMRNASPVLERGFEDRVERLKAYLQAFSNLRLSGRTARFAHTHVHDLLREGHDIAEDYARVRGRA